MAFPILGALGIAAKIVSKLLPNKPKEVIEDMIDTVVRTDKEVQGELEKTRNFYLNFFRPDLLPQWALAIKNLWRPFIALTFSVFNMVWYIIQGTMPDKYFLTVSSGIIFAMVFGRTAEKIRRKIV